MDKKKLLNTIMIGVIALSSIIVACVNVISYVESKERNKKEEVASYLNTIPSMLQIICDTDEGEYFIPNKDERKAICSYDIKTIYEYNKKAQEDLSNSVENSDNNSNSTESETETSSSETENKAE